MHSVQARNEKHKLGTSVIKKGHYGFGKSLGGLVIFFCIFMHLYKMCSVARHTVLFSIHSPSLLPLLPSLPGDPLEQLVRHFLIETGPRGVKIKGCQNESYFGQFLWETRWDELFTYLVMYKILRLIAMTFKSRESVFFICSFPSPLCFFYYCRLICNNHNLTCFLSFFLRKFICPGVPAFDYSHLSAMCPSHPRKRSNQLHYI